MMTKMRSLLVLLALAVSMGAVAQSYPQYGKPVDFPIQLLREDESTGILTNCKNVIVSLGGDGALLVGEGVEPVLRSAPQGKVVNTVGAGDSLVAGFIAEYIDSHDIKRAFKQGIATGSASAFSEYLATKEEVQALLNKMD